MSIRKIQFIFSLIFLVGYIALIIIILNIEISDILNMKKGDNSMMGELKILLGVLTGGVGQILNFWFNTANGVDKKKMNPNRSGK